jgi:succinate dehydrogenase / fumarate reductase iron-sulfur subunit
MSDAHESPAPAQPEPRAEVELPHPKRVIVSGDHLPINELLFDRPGAPSPFGEHQEFPLPVEDLSYEHPFEGATPSH